MKLLKWLSGLICNPATGQISHTKLWANIAAGCMTYKFMQTPHAPRMALVGIGMMVGGYALIKRGIAAVPQVAQIAQKGKDDVGNVE